MDKRFLIVFVLLLAGIGGWFYWSSSGGAAGASPVVLQSASSTSNTYGSASPAVTNTGTDVSPIVQQPQPTTNPSSTSGQANQNQNIMQATLHTSMGDITIAFDATDAPNTVANFIKLAQSGFYNGTKFHRVIKGFMDQAGDPLTKDDSQAARWGTGGPGYTIADENQSAHNAAGVVTMANTGQPNSGGSQFFINAVDNSFLDGKYSVFGKVTAGMDVVTAINNTPTGAGDRPVTPVVIKSVTLN